MNPKSPLIWSYDDYVKFSEHSEAIIREWAIEGLYKHFPANSGEVLKKCAKDESRRISSLAARYLKELDFVNTEKPGLDMEKASDEELLKYLFQDKKELKGVDKVITKLTTLPAREDIINSALLVLKGNLNNWGVERSVVLLGELRAVEALPEFIHLLHEKEGDALFEDIMRAFIKIGDLSLAPLDKAFFNGSHSEIMYGLGALKNIPLKKTVEIIVRHFDRLWIEYDQTLLDAVYTLGAGDFLPLVKRELREGEKEAERTYYLLCKLNNVSDSRLLNIRRQIEEDEKASGKKASFFFGNGKAEVLADEYMILRLKCKKCRRTYQYYVRNVFENIDPELPEEKNKPVILDKIACKNCLAADDYEWTSEAYLAVTAELLKASIMNKTKPDSYRGPLRIGKLGMMDGTVLAPEEGLLMYKKKIQEEPDNPENFLALGNVHRFLKQEDKAIEYYLITLEKDENSAEACACLADIYAYNNDFKKAYRYQKKCSEKIPVTRYYRTKNINEFVNASGQNLKYFAEKAGIPEERSIIQTGPEPLLKTGRNRPCPCGSGKKYKMCCFPKEKPPSPEPQKTTVGAVDSALRSKIQDFMNEKVPKNEFRGALARFPGGEKLNKDSDVAEWESFFDWFVHDYPVKEFQGRRIIEEYYRRYKDSLPQVERDLLAGWQNTLFGIYEVQGKGAEPVIIFEDIFTKERYEVRDFSGYKTLSKWDIVITRIIPISGNWQATGMGEAYPASEKEEIMEKVLDRYEEERKKTGITDLRIFLRSNVLFLREIGDGLRREKAVPPKPVTEENHPVVDARAFYKTINFEETIIRLDKAPDFILSEEYTGKNDEPEKLVYDWAKKGPSKNMPVAPEIKGVRLLKFSTPRYDQAGNKESDVLGAVIVAGKELKINCLSLERLTFCRNRLEELLRENISFLKDEIRELDNGRTGIIRNIESKDQEIPPEIRSKILKSAIGEHYGKWLKTPREDLDGQTPVQAVSDPLKKEKVRQFVKEMENVSEREYRETGVKYFFNKIKKKLGL